MIANAFGHTGGEYGFGAAREVHCHLPLKRQSLGAENI
jgi:hypothetical protein